MHQRTMRNTADETYTIGKSDKKEHKLVCVGKCATTTKHVVLTSVEYHWSIEDGNIQGVYNYEIVQCKGCDTVCFRQSSSNTEDVTYDETTGEQEYIETEMTFPSRLDGRRVLEDLWFLPSEIKDAYTETHTALSSKLPRLTAIGVRMVVELVCKHLNAEGDVLKQQIDDLVAKGKLTKENADVLHKTRLFGNEGAHGLQAPNESRLGIAMDIIESLLKNVFIIPRKAEDLNKKTK